MIASQGAETEQPVRLLFERMFGTGSLGERKLNLQRRGARQKSILDEVLHDAASLSGGANAGERRKIDHDLTSLRDIEQRECSAKTPRRNCGKRLARDDTRGTDSWMRERRFSA